MGLDWGDGVTDGESGENEDVELVCVTSSDRDLCQAVSVTPSDRDL